MTETPILDDEAVARIVARNKIGNLVISPEIAALCATVKHLRAEVDRGALCEECEQWEYNEDGSCRTFTVCGACWNNLQSQLEQLRAENERLQRELESEYERQAGADL